MSSSLELLAEIRQSSERRPFAVLKLAEPLLNTRGVSRAGDDAWLVYEQVFVSAIDEGQIELAKAVLVILRTRFPSSQRVKRLYGMINEAVGHPDEAKTIYKEMLEADETNILASKRLIALLKSYGHIGETVKQLVAYLDIHNNDFEAWLELSNLYLTQNLYPQAAFCMEEVIMQQPANHYFHLCYAEISYSMGNFDLALKEYLRVVELSTDNVRGFYGIKLVADRIRDIRAKPKRDQNARIDDAPQPATLDRLSQLATERLVAAYNGANDTCKKTAEEWLKA
ncbi:tetratricopeptide repeat domain-containing protein [Coemansia sp. RSA 2523]|nr:tetratricopeptide repeat domain-containing protein [Coemansia sp. RSA 1824]KAJ1792607.1 tetratricopeptide repeat domain-containing protein [Coemansia sp. RSA 2167]KAJ1808967.1 tetratricopeptide repeat domain-containing protein [Coemansia sp. RSA 2523]KAJ2132402.1 tetratricopeptide repeat domain-containing protein [Coemansia sp. RSA 921]KAJ2152131.1 tetratricopeptide repeat domain-containing protein [Coemansia sp. RSA 637]KAJ2165392.1 tetratricopeptide repeat domain-containing protein [Coema